MVVKLVRRVLALLPAMMLCPTMAAEGPRVVVSVLPVHSLVASVMRGVGEPELLVRGGVSPHHASLRPSSVRKLHRAELVFWIGAVFETWLSKPLGQVANGVSVDLIDAPGVELLDQRAGGVRAPHGDPDHDPAEASVDPHIWLDPGNAIAMTATLVLALERVDPGNADRYRANAEMLLGRLRALDRSLRARLEPLQDRPFIVFHDAYQYFERRYGLRSEGAVALDVEISAGARRTREIRERIVDLGVRCVFSEPQFQSSLVPVLLEDTGAVARELDPLGADIEPGPEAYFRLLNGLADAFHECLDGS